MSCPTFPGCSQSQQIRLDIVGSAPNEEAYLIVEQAKPWPAKIKKMDGLIEEIRAVLKSHGDEDFKLLATPEIPWLEESDIPRAILLRWNGQKGLAQTIEANPEVLKEALKKPEGKPEELFLVCTHGSRDPCCGLLGVPVFRSLDEWGSRKVLQVSHLGGHRFAPVIAAFPEWRFFGHLDVQSVLEMDKSLATGQAHLPGYRGHGRLKGHLQAVEAGLWQEHGSALGVVKQIAGDKEELQVKCELTSGETLHYRAKLTRIEYQGYKSCKDFRKEKESTLKLWRLASLEQISCPQESLSCSGSEAR